MKISKEHKYTNLEISTFLKLDKMNMISLNGKKKSLFSIYKYQNSKIKLARLTKIGTYDRFRI